MNLFKKIFNSSRELFVASDPMLADLGHEGEFIMARIRFILILLVAVIPLKTILFEESSFENWVGVIVALIALLFATLILIGVRKKVPSRSISWISTQTDVLLVTSAEVGFLLSPTPIIASNNMVAFGLYLILIAATALRANLKLTYAAGLMALLQYGIVIFIASRTTVGMMDPIYGSFYWDNQISRFLLIALVTLLTAAIVTRNRNYWRSSMHDKLTGLHNRRFFDEFLEYKIAECARYKRTFALIFFRRRLFQEHQRHVRP